MQLCHPSRIIVERRSVVRLRREGVAHASGGSGLALNARCLRMDLFHRNQERHREENGTPDKKSAYGGRTGHSYLLCDKDIGQRDVTKILITVDTDEKPLLRVVDGLSSCLCGGGAK